jgi:acylphosphatase
MRMQRCEVCYSGRVQGVGFRYTACRVASGLEVTGWVSNLPDGRVRLIAEGEPEALDGLLVGIRDALGPWIRNVQEQRGPATGEYRGFVIRYGPGAG